MSITASDGRAKGSALVSPPRLCGALVAVAAVFAVVAPGASAQSILNQSSTGGQTAWLESFATSGESDNSSNRLWLSALVKHPSNRSVTGIRIDDDWDGADETSSATLRSVTAQKPNVQGGYIYSRVNFNYTIPTSNTGMSCPVIGTRTRRTDNRVVRLRAQLDNGTQTPTTSSTIKFVATGQCLASEDYPYVYNQSQSATSINVGQSVTFTYQGDDKDVSGNADFEGVRWRLRRVNDGATTTPQTSCPDNGDHATKTLNVTFPRRGRWVVEAELLNNGGCSTNDNPGYWFYLGAVDVNTPASSSPTLDLNATRPSINGNTTITATAADGADSGELGRVEAIEWDLDENTSNGVSGYEQSVIADYTATSSPGGVNAAALTRTINTTGMTPGLHTVRARITDNGALGGADNIRRQSTDTVSFLVNTPPFANNQSFATETQTALPITLDTGDANGDALTYNVTDAPDNGALSGTGANRTYTPAVGFAGTDSFTYSVDDGFGGTDTATVTIRVDPDTTIDAGPTGTLDDRGAEFEFSSRATGATFECSLDGATFASCDSPLVLTDLADGAHELRVRAVAAGNTDQSPASRSWTIDASPVVEIDSAPDAETADTSAAFTFTTSEQGATVDPTTACKLDGGDFRPCSSPITYTDLDDGEHTFVVRATDAYGKQATDSHTWSIDAVGSNTLIDQAPPAHTASTDAEIEFSSPDADATFECRLDAGPWLECESPQSYSGLSEGSHTFRVRAIDMIGTIDPTPASARWRVDLTPPESSIDVGPPDPGNDATPTFEFSADEHGSTFECRLDSGDPGDWVSCTSPHTTGQLDEGDHELEVRATDAVGNVETSPASRAFEIDLTAPSTEIVSGPADGSVEATASATFGFESASDPGASFQCRIDTGNWRPCDGPSSQTYSGLADGEHTFSVRSRDAAGNVDGGPPQRTWTVDTTAPQTSINGGPHGLVRNADAAFGLAADDPGATFECALDGEPFGPCDSPQEYSGLADGQHEFRARATDQLGNTDPTPASRSWSIDTSSLEAPNQQPGPPARQRCTFAVDLAYCADPFMVAKADGTTAAGKQGFGKLALKANGGGADLGAARFDLPKSFRAVVLDKAARIGTLRLSGMRRETTVALRGTKTMATGAPTVRRKGGRISITDLSNRVRRLKLTLRSPQLKIAAKRCGETNWTGRLTDRDGNTEEVATISDVRCLGTGGAR